MTNDEKNSTDSIKSIRPTKSLFCFVCLNSASKFLSWQVIWIWWQDEWKFQNPIHFILLLYPELSKMNSRWARWIVESLQLLVTCRLKFCFQRWQWLLNITCIGKADFCLAYFWYSFLSTGLARTTSILEFSSSAPKIRSNKWTIYSLKQHFKVLHTTIVKFILVYTRDNPWGTKIPFTVFIKSSF